MKHDFLIRAAFLTEVQEIAAVFRAARERSMPYLPALHTPDEDSRFLRERVFKENRIIVACKDARIVGFCGFRHGWIDHLYILPEFPANGCGYDAAKKRPRNSAETRAVGIPKESDRTVVL